MTETAYEDPSTLRIVYAEAGALGVVLFLAVLVVLGAAVVGLAVLELRVMKGSGTTAVPAWTVGVVPMLAFMLGNARGRRWQRKHGSDDR